jgi:hypothetical protein
MNASPLRLLGEEGSWLSLSMNDEECMGRVPWLSLRLAVAVFSLLTISGCGGGSHPGPPLFPGHINLTPSSSISVTVGGTLGFAATVQTTSGTTLNTTITFASSDTSILNVAPNGVACAGHWDAAFINCTPGATGPVTVTASALGGTSVPTYVFVHPPIDNISVVGILPSGGSVQEPCLSQSQAMTVEAHAYSRGADVTTSVGPFTWSANNSAVVTLDPLNNSTFNFPTNQATATATAPGITYIYASASGVTSSSFQQPQLTNSQGTASPVLDFFATCAIQNIALELGAAGSGQTSFAVPKGSADQTIVATVIDIMGYSSLPRSDGGLVLSKTPLTWISSQPGSIGIPAGACTQSCALTLSNPGSASVTASCSPPTCNIGFPTIPNAFLTNGQLDTTKIDNCTTYFQALYPQLQSCQQLIPVPVYASPVFIDPSDPSNPTPRTLSFAAAISGVVTGAASTATVFASSTGCSEQPPSACNSFGYNVTSRSAAGNATQLPVSPNSFLTDPTGARVWMGSKFGAQIVTPSNFGSSTSPFTSLGTVTGNVLASSLNGTAAVFSDRIHQPEQVYVVGSGNSSSPAILNIPNATMAAFSADGLKTYIVSTSTQTSVADSLYIYSPLQAVQGPFTLAGSARAFSSSPNGAFTYIAQASVNSSGARLDAYSNCNNQVAASLALPADPILMKVLPALPMGSTDSSGFPILPAIPLPGVPAPEDIHVLVLDSTGFDVITMQTSVPPLGSVCPQGTQFVSGNPANLVQRIELGQGTLQPLDFFFSADNTQLYVVSSTTSSILVYSIVNNAVTGGIQLQNNALPITADMSPDGGTIVIAGSDGLLHEVSTELGGSDSIPISFSNAPNAQNPFCSLDPSGIPCKLNVAQAKP